MSEGERYDTWRHARAGLLKIIIGARSALFFPLPNIGLIVVDECHDSSYYQADPPFYHAVSRLNICAAGGRVCVLGSATPTVIQRYQSDDRDVKRLELPRRVFESGLPPVQLVDMREELKAGEREIFSRFLLRNLRRHSSGEQAILFLNRRGTATYIFCRDCGYVLRCPNCDTPLTLHIEDRAPTRERLLCHHCGYERGKPQTCPSCGGRQIREYGLGSERVEKELSTLFPHVRPLRWDWETTRKNTLMK